MRAHLKLACIHSWLACKEYPGVFHGYTSIATSTRHGNMNGVEAAITTLSTFKLPEGAPLNFLFQFYEHYQYITGAVILHQEINRINAAKSDRVKNKPHKQKRTFYEWVQSFYKESRIKVRMR